MQTFLKNNKNILISILASMGISLTIILPVLLFDLLNYIFGTH